MYKNIGKVVKFYTARSCIELKFENLKLKILRLLDIIKNGKSIKNSK